MALVVKDEGKIGLHLTTSKTIDLKDQRENARPKHFSGYMETNNININIKLAFVTKCPTDSLPNCFSAQMVNETKTIRKQHRTHSHMNCPLSSTPRDPYRTEAPAPLTYTPKPRYIPLNSHRWLHKKK